MNRQSASSYQENSLLENDQVYNEQSHLLVGTSKGPITVQVVDPLMKTLKSDDWIKRIGRRCRRSVLFILGAVIGVWCIITLTVIGSNLPNSHDYAIANDEEVSYGSSSLFLTSILSFPSAYNIHQAQEEANEAMKEFLSSDDNVDSNDNNSDSSIEDVNEGGSIVQLSFPEHTEQPQTQGTAADVTVNFWNQSFEEDGQWVPDENMTMLLGRKHGSSLQDGCEATVMILRHCEKGSVREHCDYDGFQRSVYLATQFGHHENDRWPLPSYIFATNPAGRGPKQKLNLREIELVSPLAHKAHIRIDDSYKVGDEHILASKILKFMKTGDMCGKLLVISWKHSLIGKLARKLGCGPEQGCPLDYRGKLFDDIWDIRFVYMTPKHSLHKSLRLDHKPSWFVYGSVQKQGFDPLSVSKQYGDYPAGGTSTAGRWQSDVISFPERRSIADKSIWRQSNVGFEDGSDT